MKNFETVNFNSEEIDIIYSALSDLGIELPMNYCRSGCIPKELLQHIKKVVIKGTYLANLDFLAKLPNLEELSIINFDYDNVCDIFDYSEHPYFNQIFDYSGIERLSKLKKLKISNDVYLKELDLSNLQELKHLELVDNPKLTKLSGMGKLHKLSTVKMYGNHITEFDDFLRYLYNTVDANENVVDLSVLFSYVKSLDDLKMVHQLFVKGLMKIKFSEKNGQTGHFEMMYPLVEGMYKKLYSVLKRAKMFDKNLSDEEKIDYIYKFVTNNIKFADDELHERERFYVDEVKPRYGSIPDFYKSHFGSVHNSYYAYDLKRANCEGMVNLMKFMASMLDIDSEDVHCSDKRGMTINNNHAIFRTNYNGVVNYFDPAYRVTTRSQRKKGVGNFGRLSYDDVSSYLNLSRFEKVVSYESYGKKILELIDNVHDLDSENELNKFLLWLYDENILKEPFDEIIESNFDNDLGREIINKEKKNVKKRNG